jgi:hypothetical protein
LDDHDEVAGDLVDHIEHAVDVGGQLDVHVAEDQSHVEDRDDFGLVVTIQNTGELLRDRGERVQPWIHIKFSFRLGIF